MKKLKFFVLKILKDEIIGGEKNLKQEIVFK